MSEYKLLATKLKVPDCSDILKTALTHKSFFKQEDEAKGNSRYVFAGMYAFKGLVADALFRYVPASGTHLQHTLGNLFKNQHLERLFAYYELEYYIRTGPDFDKDSHRHIFAYALLGFLYAHATEEVILEFIRRHFILPYSGIIMQDAKKRNIDAQCNFICSMLFGNKTKVNVAMQKDGTLWRTTVTAKERILAEESSTGYRYSRRKSLKKALIALSDLLNEQSKQSSDYEVKNRLFEDALQQKMESEKAQRQEAYAEKAEKRKAERAARRELQKKLAIELDIKRRKAKAAAKQRKEEQAKKAAEATAKLSGMSANKRRHLQDKGQLK